MVSVSVTCVIMTVTFMVDGSNEEHDRDRDSTVIVALTVSLT